MPVCIQGRDVTLYFTMRNVVKLREIVFVGTRNMNEWNVLKQEIFVKDISMNLFI